MTPRPTPYCTPKAGNRLLVLRFSALGDIMMTVPVIDALARRYPQLEIYFASRPYVGSVFDLLTPNVHFVGIDPRGKNNYDIFKIVKELHPDIICDLHFTLRTIIIDILFLLNGKKIRRLAKNKLSIRNYFGRIKVSKYKRVFERYANVFAKAGYPIELQLDKPFNLFDFPEHRQGIGIAPFAAHQGKILPLDKMEKLVSMLCSEETVYLFGAGENEKRILSDWEQRYPNVKNMAGTLENMAAELRFMSGLKLMVTMDSGNMHLASLAGTRAISIWGATHPLTGFLGWGQKLEDCIQLDIPCRPCSFYGNKPCRLGNYPCLTGIRLDTITKKIKQAL